ncbi:hypothetical protein [Ascidiaceihabitans sp.]|uniref:hypothetical protein n=1 Tax=Ascidiaceihabitans sp. TaxID=1872644 RepID=UPI0032987CED
MKFRVDLNTHVIRNDVRVFVAAAGRNGQLYEMFERHSAVGPELPNLNLDLRNGLDNEPNLIAKINRGREISKWAWSSAHGRSEAPSVDLKDYDNDKKKPGHAQIEGVVQRYFSTMLDGDVVVIPSKSFYGFAIIAELGPIVENSAVQMKGTGRYEGYSFEGRPFVHIRKVPMKAIPRRIVDISKTPSALAEISESRVLKSVLDLLYDEFVFDDQFSGRIQTTKQEFGSFDNAVLNALVNVVAVNLEAIEAGNTKALISFDDAVFCLIDGESPMLRIDIQSPGYMRIIARSITPLVTTVLLSVLSQTAIADVSDASEIVIEVVNGTAELQELCSVPVGHMAQQLLNLMEDSEFERVCELVAKTVERTGARTNIGVEVQDE